MAGVGAVWLAAARYTVPGVTGVAHQMAYPDSTHKHSRIYRALLSERDHKAAPAAMNVRRQFLTALPLIGASAGGLAGAAPARQSAPAKSERFPGDPPEHKIVYQLNRVDADYIHAILGSVGALLGKYEDNVAIAVVVFGRGIHLLAKKPLRPVAKALREHARSQARDYGVRFIACGNTMATLGWTEKDIVDFASVEEVGAAALMELQEQGYAYLAW